MKVGRIRVRPGGTFVLFLRGVVLIDLDVASSVSTDRQRGVQLVNRLLDVPARSSVAHAAGPQTGELHVDALQGPKVLAHASVGLGLRHRLTPAPAASTGA